MNLNGGSENSSINSNIVWNDKNKACKYNSALIKIAAKRNMGCFWFQLET